MANELSTSQRYETILREEEIFDVSLATFNVFDKENGRVFDKEKGSSGGVRGRRGCNSAWYSIADVQGLAPSSGLSLISQSPYVFDK
jgi:hypothetical protein